MSRAEDIHAALKMADAHAGKFYSSLAGRVDPERVKRDLLAVQLQGYEIGRKSVAEIEADCAKMEGRRRTGRGVTGRRGYTKAQKRRIIDRVHGMVADGTGFLEACRMNGTTDKSYYKWTADLGIERKAGRRKAAA